MNVLDMLSPAAEDASVLCPPSPAMSTASSASSTASSSTSEDAKRGWVAPFLLHLHQMLRRENPRVIRWAEDGKAFEILDKEALTHQILPRYFKNKNFASFQRQLNYFGFRKWSKARAAFPTYSREHFTRDNYDDMALVKRQSKKSRKRKASTASDEQEPSKRPASQTYWVSSDKCKPILPRPEEAISTPSPVVGSASSEVSSMPSMWLPVRGSGAPSAPLPSLSAISPTRKVASSFKLPSIHELPSLSSGFSPLGAIRPRLMA
jgi:hypothetical protein